MAILGLMRRIFAQSQTTRLLKRMMLEDDKYANIRLSTAVTAAAVATAATNKRMCDYECHYGRPSPTGSSASTCRASDISPVAARQSSSIANECDDDSSDYGDESDESDSDSEPDASIAVGAPGSQNRLSISACVVVPAQRVSDALWIDKLRAQEETYKRSLSSTSHESDKLSDNDNTVRRRCETEDDAFELWDYVCPQLVRPQLANEWV